MNNFAQGFSKALTHFMLLVSFDTQGFLMFSGVLEKVQCVNG